MLGVHRISDTHASKRFTSRTLGLTALLHVQKQMHASAQLVFLPLNRNNRTGFAPQWQRVTCLLEKGLDLVVRVKICFLSTC